MSAEQVDRMAANVAVAVDNDIRDVVESFDRYQHSRRFMTRLADAIPTRAKFAGGWKRFPEPRRWTRSRSAPRFNALEQVHAQFEEDLDGDHDASIEVPPPPSWGRISSEDGALGQEEQERQQERNASTTQDESSGRSHVCSDVLRHPKPEMSASPTAQKLENEASSLGRTDEHWHVLKSSASDAGHTARAEVESCPSSPPPPGEATEAEHELLLRVVQSLGLQQHVDWPPTAAVAARLIASADIGLRRLEEPTIQSALPVRSARKHTLTHAHTHARTHLVTHACA